MGPFRVGLQRIIYLLMQRSCFRVKSGLTSLELLDLLVPLKLSPPPRGQSMEVSRNSQRSGLIFKWLVNSFGTCRLRELLSEVAPGEILDPEVEEFLQEHAIGFVESVTEFACRIAKNRESETLEAQDVQLYLEKTWNMRIPGYGDTRKPVRRFAPSPAHASRMQMVNKAKMQAAANNTSNK
uniref:Transcription initiation factor TFIID subunit 12 domain-containing protein n=1 Tax=Rhodosorus marinus TaxID=101924 RepID=A0A7S3E8U6_9RHOD|mmetsp:Transcript_18104/g.72453  ORF Transcript_18104/g.72453 Transcript_18104/m.72453 type:complete len:182 (+) Transcript_18104:408-953(+)